MTKRYLRELVASREQFIVLAEYVPLPGHRLVNFEKFLAGYAEKKSQIPSGFVLGGITIPQSPGGVASMSPADIFAVLDQKGLWDDLEVIPHVTAKDHNTDAIETYLVGLQKLGMESVLALTGDKPTQAKGVFEIDSIGLIELIKEMNNRAFDKAKPENFDNVQQFYTAAAVSQFKYTEASQMQQYYKLAKKVTVGAHCLMTQVGWDYRKCEELFRYMAEQGINTPVFGNVYFLTTMTPAPRLMHEGKLPGCVVTKELFDTLKKETPAEHLERAALQVAMYRDLGAVGVDIGSLFDFDMLVDILNRADEIGSNWREYKDKLDYGVKGGFYLYNDDGSSKLPSHQRKKLSKRNYDLFHYMLFTPGKGIRGAVKKLFGLSKGLKQGTGAMTTLFHSFFEKPMKTLLFHCEDCGDCFLAENFSICSMGRCEKGLNNSPCGDANPDGTCGNNVDIRCVGELIYEAAVSEGPQGLTKLASQINPKRNPLLAGTSSILNNFFDRDHCRHVDLVQVGDCINSFMPKVGTAMEQLLAKGDGAYEQPSGALNYLTSLISSQVMHHADYVAINVDKFAKDSHGSAIDMMRQYVKLVGRIGQGVPVCIDSKHTDVLKAGLSQWYSTHGEKAMPLIRAVTGDSADEILPWRSVEPFKVVVMLSGENAEEMHDIAKKVFDTAVEKYGFQADDMFFELPVKPLMDDQPENAASAATYRTFRAVSKMMGETSMKGVHTIASVAYSARKVPGRSIGICRAYVAAGQEYGLSAIIADTTKDFGYTPPANDLVELVDTFAKQDGTSQAKQRVIKALDAFVKANQKAKKS